MSQLTYACSVWYLFPGRKRHQKNHLEALESVQAKAIRIIKKNYKTTSSPVLDIKVRILPLKFYLTRMIGESLLRLVISTRYLQFINMRSKSKLYKLIPLEAPTVRFEPLWKTTLGSIEKIVHFIISPWEESSKVYIERDKLQAKIFHKRLLQTLSIESTSYYKHGSEINKKVGDASVQLGKTFKNVSAFFGSSIYDTVYIAEISGVLLALNMVLADSSISQGRRIPIFTDNQFALRSIYKPRKTF